MSIRVVKPGLLTTVQDQGRYGYQRYGVPVGGVMDHFASRCANFLVGNGADEAVLEITATGPVLAFAEHAVIAVCGADMSARVGQEPLPLWRPVFVPAGTEVEFGHAVLGWRTYLAVAGGIRVPPVLGSAGTYLRGRFGGFGGRALQAGDMLPTGQPARLVAECMKTLAQRVESPFLQAPWFASPSIFPEYAADPVIRVVEGREFHAFREESRQAFLSGEFVISPQSDRMGYRLRGDTPLQSENPREMISEAVTIGTIQVPPGGQPIILMADRQTSGGYPRIGQAAAVDLPVLAQSAPGTKVRFRLISQQEAEALYLRQEADMDFLRKSAQMRWNNGVADWKRATD